MKCITKEGRKAVVAFHGGARHRYVIEYVSLTLATISHNAAGIRQSLYFNTTLLYFCWGVQYVSMFTASRTCGGDYRHGVAKPPCIASNTHSYFAFPSFHLLSSSLHGRVRLECTETLP